MRLFTAIFFFFVRVPNTWIDAWLFCFVSVRRLEFHSLWGGRYLPAARERKNDEEEETWHQDRGTISTSAGSGGCLLLFLHCEPARIACRPNTVTRHIMGHETTEWLTGNCKRLAGNWLGIAENPSTVTVAVARRIFYYSRTNNPSLLITISAEVYIYKFTVRGTAASYSNEACIIPCPSQEARYFHTGTYNGTCIFYPAFLFP